MNYPEMFRLRQIFDAPRCDEVYGAVRAEIDKLDPGSKITKRPIVRHPPCLTYAYTVLFCSRFTFTEM